jgi:hypothetical protein
MTNPSQITPMLSVDDVEQAVDFYKHQGLGVILYVDVKDSDTFYNTAKKTGVHLI